MVEKVLKNSTLYSVIQLELVHLMHYLKLKYVDFSQNNKRTGLNKLAQGGFFSQKQ